ncbi:MAG: glycosyltransferase family 2 protein [bacterium]|nr:glycosyltransferase family 2 protein [bacterium]
MVTKVFIIILNWNGKNDTIECLNSLNSTCSPLVSSPDYTTWSKVLIVDNASTDNSLQLIVEKFPSIQIIKNKTNLGFAGGMNIGIKEAIKNNSKYVLLLNQDIIVDKNFLNKLLDLAESDSKIGIVGPKIYYSNSLKKIWAIGIRFVAGIMREAKVPYCGTELIGCNEIDNKQYDNLKEVESIPGCCMLIRTEVIRKIGLMDESFFLIHEDDDYCLSASEAGYKVCVSPESVIWHKISTSSRLLTEKINEYSGSNTDLIYYWHRNWLWVLRKHFEKKVFFKVFGTYIFRLFPIRVYELLRDRKLKSNIIYAYMRAFRDGLLS